MALKLDYKFASPEMIATELGRRVSARRLQRNLTQTELASEAGISKRTLVRFEAGEGGTVDTLIRIMRALGAAESLDVMLPETTISPLDAVPKPGVRMTGRQRASKKRGATTKSGKGWSWDEKELPE